MFCRWDLHPDSPFVIGACYCYTIRPQMTFAAKGLTPPVLALGKELGRWPFETTRPCDLVSSQCFGNASMSLYTALDKK